MTSQILGFNWFPSMYHPMSYMHASDQINIHIHTHAYQIFGWRVRRKGETWGWHGRRTWRRRGWRDPALAGSLSTAGIVSACTHRCNLFGGHGNRCSSSSYESIYVYVSTTPYPIQYYMVGEYLKKQKTAASFGLQCVCGGRKVSEAYMYVVYI